MESIKEKTISGLTWSIIDHFSHYGITFIIGIFLARLLTPREFGLIGMTTLFIAVSQSVIDSGFTQALIRKQNCTQTDYSTAFYFNIVVGLVLYFTMFLSAGAISKFFNEPQLKFILQVLGIGLIINAFTIIQRARLTKRIDFKLQTKISVISSIVSGIVGIVLAFYGYGVWSLVIKTLITYALSSILLWLWNRWKPSFIFSWLSFKELFGFGSKLLISGLIDTVYKNIFLLIIGKFFSASELGFYSRADQFKNLASSSITTVIQRVSYPVLASLQNDIPRLKSAYQTIIKSTMLITFIVMIVMAAVAKPLVITLIGEKWLPSVIYLQLLCFVGVFFPLQAINLNMLKVLGRSDLFLRLEIIKKILIIPFIIIGFSLGIKYWIIGLIILSVIGFFLNSHYSGPSIGYSSFQQIKDILPSFFLAVFIGSIVFLIGLLLKTPVQITLTIQIFTGLMLTFGLLEILQIKDYLFMKKIIVEKLFKKKDDNR